MKRNLRLAMTIAALTVAPAVFAQSTDSGSTQLQVTFGPEAQFTAVLATTNLTKSETKFGNFSGTTTFTYKIRTTQTSGTGSITVQVTTFGTGGPAVGDLSYTCTSPSSGTPCNGSTTASSSAGTTVVTFGPDAHSADGGDSGSTVWSLVDRTTIQTGAYSSTATYTISAT